MELPKISLDGIKSRLGVGGNKNDDYADDYEDEYYDDEPYDEGYDDGYGDAGYDDGYSSRSYGSSYGGDNGYSDDISTRPASEYRPVRTSTVSSPRLVTIDDVKAHTQVPERLNRDPLPERRVTTSRDTSSAISSSSARTLLDSTAPAPYSPADTAAKRERSEGLNSLFEPTDSPRTLAQSSTTGLKTATSSAGGSLGFSPSRSVQVMKPVSYNEAERIAKILRAGDVAVISLRNTPDTTGKRILDFSFGVACALNARVDCIADKVFVLNGGADLTDSERFSLRTQGVL